MTALSGHARYWQALVLGGAVGLAGALSPAPAYACGGFFCQATNPVNQAAERIIFANEGDGKLTAVIEIKYQGPSTDFSWLLPVSGVPERIGVASTQAFDRLQQQTNPQYNLTVRVEGTCAQEPNQGNRSGGPSALPGASVDLSDTGNESGVMVEASGVVGPFDWTVISLDASFADPAQAAVEWLGADGYDVPQGAPVLL